MLAKDLINKFSILNGSKYFSLEIFQNYLVFMPAKTYIKYFSITTPIVLWKCNRMSKENIENNTNSDNFTPTFVNHHLLPDINFKEHCLINNNVYILKKVIHLYIFYILNQWLRKSNTDFKRRISNCLFGSVELTKNTDLDKYKYSDHSIGFDSRSEFSFTYGITGKYVIIFGADMSLSVDIDNKNEYILILGEIPTQRLDDTTLTAKAKYPITFTQPRKRFVLSLYYNRSHSFLLINKIFIEFLNGIVSASNRTKCV